MKLFIIGDVIVFLCCLGLIIWAVCTKDWMWMAVNIINTMTWSVLLYQHIKLMKR